ncbi:MAG: hypothetical protein IPO86_00175 [Saprospiraceae bacterium]|nr:hypothetical protein [Saprospiraceae bacterium]MBK8483000.1 hypothetical protein [Saprospiraceae bacterium]MBK9726512.1 hypothetical protein [Saprospiraceae bacterium]
MKILIILILLQLSIQPQLSGQKDSFDLIYRDWYAKDYGDKEFNIGDILILDTLKVDPKVNHNFMKWEFQRNGDFINLYFYLRKEGNFKGEVIGISDDDLKWELDTSSSELKIKKKDFVFRYKILNINKSKLILRKLNSNWPPEGK